MVSDGPAPNRATDPGGPPAQVLWATGAGAATGNDPAPAGHAFGFHSEGGTLLRVVDFPPDDEYDTAALGDFLDEHGVRDDDSSSRHFWSSIEPSGSSPFSQLSSFSRSSMDRMRMMRSLAA